MPMGIVSDEDFHKEKSSLDKTSENPPVPTATILGEIKNIERGRGQGNVEVPDSLRKVIGETSAIDGPAEATSLAKQFGISRSSVSAYAVGATSTASYDEQPNVQHINGAKEKISKRARAKLMLALKNLTPETMASAKARDLAGIAKDMSAVIRTMEPETPKSPGESNNGPTFIFYSPQQRKEETFDVVFTKE